MAPMINKRKCPAQEILCKAIAACPTQAIMYVADDAEPLGGKIVFDSLLCNDCGVCVQACCGSAISMQ